MRASMGGWVENSASIPGDGPMPADWMDFGNSPVSTRPRVESALIMLFGSPVYGHCNATASDVPDTFSRKI